MLRSLLLLLVGFGYLALCFGSQEVALPNLTLQVQSRAQVRAGSFLSHLLRETDDFLHSYFIDYLSKTGPTYTNLGDVDLRIVSYDTTGDYYADKMETSIVILEGRAIFDDAPTPSEGIMSNLVRAAFQSSSRLELVARLLSSQNTFLSSMEFLVVSVDGVVIATEDLSSGTESKTPGSDDDSSSTKLIILIASVVGILCLSVGVGIFVAFLCRRKNKGAAPVTAKRSRRRNKHQHDLEMQPTRSPSPVRSIASQDSSKFTFNPRFAGASGDSKSADSKSLPSNFSAIQVDVSQAVDVNAWTNNTISPITPAPFGHDISAIENKKDLSLIEEGSQEDITPASKSGSYLSKDSLLRVDYSVPTQYTTSSKKSHSTQGLNHVSFYSEADDSLAESDGSDVIRDLQNLSVQIRSHRGSSRL